MAFDQLQLELHSDASERENFDLGLASLLVHELKSRLIGDGSLGQLEG
jgi:hypothetical protein